jgi:substrate import-associated zinc metallohydrolase lipoprotein
MNTIRQQMKLISKFLLAAALLTTTAIGCRKEDDDLDIPPPVGLGGETWVKTAIDQWLLDSLTKPYNINVKYKWDPWEYNLDKTLTPADESKVIPAMSAIKRVWIDPYNAETGSDLFMKKYSAKQFVLVGSVEYNYNGTVVLGQAEGGANISFFDINQNFDSDPISSYKRMIQTSHHEFAHILHQNVMYPQEFKGISGNLGLTGYTATWFNISAGEALANGYITPYSMASYDEDFVEMVANMLMEGRTRFNEIVASTNATAQEALRRKEEIVVGYFKRTWNIDFYSLQTRVQAALNSLVPIPPADEAFGFGNEYSTASVNPTDPLTPQRSSFVALFNAAKTNIAALPYGLVLDSFAIIGADANVAVVRAYLQQGANTFFADFGYTYQKGGGGLYTFTYLGANGNGELTRDAMLPLLNYLETNQFALSWYADPSVTIHPRIKFTPQAIPNTYFLARLYP